MLRADRTAQSQKLKNSKTCRNGLGAREDDAFSERRRRWRTGGGREEVKGWEFVSRLDPLTRPTSQDRRLGGSPAGPPDRSLARSLARSLRQRVRRRMSKGRHLWSLGGACPPVGGASRRVDTRRSDDRHDPVGRRRRLAGSQRWAGFTMKRGGGWEYVCGCAPDCIVFLLLMLIDVNNNYFIAVITLVRIAYHDV